mmetsp:Transcript_2836/g.9200  ORF Transcript_2836/g.9200 Transcript_2836/m.9200 type:complete len:320 (-) Transcript_2836:52-1011(-)
MNDVLQMYQRFDTTEVQRREMHRSRLKSHFAKRSDERRALIDAGEDFSVPKDLLTALLTASDPDTGAPLTQDEIDLTLTEMMVAGHDTTAATVACALCALCAAVEKSDPYEASALADVVAEIDAFCDANGGALPRTTKDVASLVLTEDAMKEAMRLYPAVLVVVREAEELGDGGDIVVEPGPDDSARGRRTIRVPPGTGLWMSPYVYGRLPKCWGEDSDEAVARYRPERWAAMRENGESAPDAYMPFGGGPRVCLGSRFATLEGKTLLAAILRNFELELSPGLRRRMRENGGELPVTYAAGLMTFPEPLRLIARPRRRE